MRPVPGKCPRRMTGTEETGEEEAEEVFGDSEEAEEIDGIEDAEDNEVEESQGE